MNLHSQEDSFDFYHIAFVVWLPTHYDISYSVEFSYKAHVPFICSAINFYFLLQAGLSSKAFVLIQVCLCVLLLQNSFNALAGLKFVLCNIWCLVYVELFCVMTSFSWLGLGKNPLRKQPFYLTLGKIYSCVRIKEKWKFVSWFSFWPYKSLSRPTIYFSVLRNRLASAHR